MKKILLLLLIITSVSYATPLQVANNIYNEFKQVIELIKQLKELKKQLESKAKQIQNMSGKKEFIISQLENSLRNWNPNGEELLEPTGGSSDPESYIYSYNEIKSNLDLFDLAEIYGIQDENDTSNPNYVMFKAGSNYQKTTIASAAYGKTVLAQGTKRNSVINSYVQMVGQAETIKESTDIQAQILAQATYNQIEINKTMAMLLQLKSASGQKVLAQERWLYNLLKKREN